MYNIFRSNKIFHALLLLSIIIPQSGSNIDKKKEVIKHLVQEWENSPQKTQCENYILALIGENTIQLKDIIDINSIPQELHYFSLINNYLDNTRWIKFNIINLARRLLYNENNLINISLNFISFKLSQINSLVQETQFCIRDYKSNEITTKIQNAYQECLKLEEEVPVKCYYNLYVFNSLQEANSAENSIKESINNNTNVKLDAIHTKENMSIKNYHPLFPNIYQKIKKDNYFLEIQKKNEAWVLYWVKDLKTLKEKDFYKMREKYPDIFNIEALTSNAKEMKQKKKIISMLLNIILHTCFDNSIKNNNTEYEKLSTNVLVCHLLQIIYYIIKSK